MDYSMPQIEGIDWEKAHRYIPTKSLLLEVLKEFILSADSQCEKLMELRHQVLSNGTPEDFVEYRIQAHSMKSSLRSLGADLFDLAFELETAGKEEDEEIIEEKTAAFIEEYKQLAGVLQEMVGAQKTTIEYDRELFLLLTGKIKKAMEGFAVSELQTNVDRLFSIEGAPTETKPIMEELKVAARDLAMDEVIDCCNRLEEIVIG